MKKQLIGLLGGVALSLGLMNANAQQGWLPNGNFAPDWTLTDINGNSHNLYSILNQGYTVYLDFSATWCGPCWAYHTGRLHGTGGVGSLHKLWEDHGPAGQPGVSPATTNDCYVFFIEADGYTNTACLYGASGCNGTTQGNWVAGT